MNLSKGDFFLVICHIVNTFFADRPQTTLSINGKKGGGKTYCAETIKKILDPSVTLTLDLPKTRDELLHNLDHHFYPCFDNVSWLSHEFSDIFCRANTGAGTFKRVLYTNDEEFIRAFLKSININGINVIIVREDLLDRTILVFPLPFNGNRKTEFELEEEFNRIYPYVLHDLYTLISEVLSILPKTEAPTEFRMIDYAQIGCAVSKAFGYDRAYFIKIYREKLLTQIKEAVYNDTFGNVLLSFIEDAINLTELEKGVFGWKGATAKLYAETKSYAKNVLLTSVGKKSYPSASNIMSRQINDLTDAFSKIGINITPTRSSTTRGWRIINTNYNPEEPTKTELEKLEDLITWIEKERIKGQLKLEDVKAKIKELDFKDSEKTVLNKLREKGAITGANEELELGDS